MLKNKRNIIIIIFILILIFFVSNKQFFTSKKNNKIDLIIYINLDKRKDRKKDVKKFIKKINNKNIPVHRLSATLNKKNGHIGCADSHIRALKYAKEQNANNVLILEDDVSLNCTEKEFNKKIEYFFKNYKNFDAVTLYGYWKKGIINLDNNISKFSPKDGYSTTTLAYIINRKSLDDFIQVFSEAKEKMIEELKSFKKKRKFNTIHAIDREWKILQQRKLFYIFEPNIVKPSGSISEILINY